MPFNSLQYAGFLLLVVAVYWLLQGHQAKRWLLLLASYGFYASWDWRFTLLLLADSLVAFAAGRALGRTGDAQQRRRIVIAALVFNLGVLATFKYLDFFYGSFRDLADVFGLSPPHFVARLVLPVGISFFTFQTVAYVIDVYRRELDPCESPLTFLLFSSYFPHLLAGPIVRARRLIPQVERPPSRINTTQFTEGLELILIGLFQKVAVADALAPVTSRAFGAFSTSPGSVSTANLWIGVIASVIQFILDFAGYSNIARGTSKLLGIELPYNFRQPLTRSRNFQDFWRREHMTLMAWFRDYVYRPLHDRRAPRWRNQAALLVVFALSGLWHGASWVWVTWGFLMGGVLITEIEVRRVLAQRRERRAPGGPTTGPVILGAADVTDAPAGTSPATGPDTAGPLAQAEATARASAPATRLIDQQWVRAVYIILLAAVQVAWIRTGAISQSLDLYRHLLVPSGHGLDIDALMLLGYAVVALVLVDARQVTMEEREARPDPVTTLRAAGFGAMVLFIIVFSGEAPQPFVYFQF